MLGCHRNKSLTFDNPLDFAHRESINLLASQPPEKKDLFAGCAHGPQNDRNEEMVEFQPDHDHRNGGGPHRSSPLSFLCKQSFGLIVIVMLLMISSTRFSSNMLSFNNPETLAAQHKVGSLSTTGGAGSAAPNESSMQTTTTTTTVKANKPYELPDFVFLVGIEGSGHHLWQALIEASPNYRTLQKLDLVNDAQELTKQLYNRFDLDTSLFGAACNLDGKWNGTAIIEQTASKLRDLSNKLKKTDRPSGASAAKVTVPLNGIPGTNKASGMMSYPNFSTADTKCSPLRNPSLNMLYAACTKAGVLCQHIVQHREPFATIRSTAVKRRFHKRTFATNLYAAMSEVVIGQMVMFPDRLATCWSYGPPPKRVQNLLGWTDPAEFEKDFAQVYTPPAVQKAGGVVPERLEALMSHPILVHGRLKDTCKSISTA